jgi:hypothetical protein
LTFELAFSVEAYGLGRFDCFKTGAPGGAVAGTLPGALFLVSIGSYWSSLFDTYFDLF